MKESPLVEIEPKVLKVKAEQSTRKLVMTNSVQEQAKDQKEEIIVPLTASMCGYEYTKHFDFEY